MRKKVSMRKLILVTALCLFLPCSFAGIKDCDTSDSIIFNCSGAGLTAIPSDEDIPKHFETLDLSNNYITNISHLNFPSINVITLLLANNQINNIQTEAFKQMKHLITLDLSGNKLEGHSIMEQKFYELNRLKVLNMERNPLQFILKGAFSFTELPILRHLDLSHCEINEIYEDAFALTDLVSLDLSWNKLETINPDSYHMLHELKTLDLSHNRLTVLDQIPSLFKISVLNLDNNEISNVSIKDEVWVLADSLEYLYLRNNDIMRFTADSIPWDLDTIKGIYLDKNPIHCDCGMKWAVKDEDLQRTNFTIPCTFPSKHQGKNLITIPPDELTCGTPAYKIFLLIGLSFVVVLCFMILIVFIVRRRKSKKFPKQQTKTVRGTNYTAVYTKDEDDIRVHISDEKSLLSDKGTEFDV